MRVEDQREADDHEQELRGEVDDGEEDVETRRLLDPDDVQRDERDDDDHAADDVPGVLAQRAPEDREVVRHEERRDGDRDDVVEHLRPGSAEGDELVEGVPGEARRAAGFRIANRALGVGRRRGREDQAADHEDERCQPERDPRDEPEGVVDGRADVAVRSREERRCPEDALERLLPPPAAPPGRLGCRRAHARRLEVLAASTASTSSAPLRAGTSRGSRRSGG